MWVDVENAAGVKQGALQISHWQYVERLDQVGEWNAETVATDGKADLVLHKRRVRAWGQLHPGAEITGSAFGGGIIDEIRLDTGSILHSIGGDNLLAELNTRYMQGALLSDGSDGPMAAGSVLAAILAPMGGSWTATGIPSQGAYIQLADESVFQALTKFAEVTGDHFRLAETGRVIEWLSAPDDSGVRAEKGADPIAVLDNPAVCLVGKGLRITGESRGVFSRAYPYGGGNEDARLTIKSSAVATPSGFTDNRADPSGPYWIERDDTVAEYGRIDRMLPLSDISPKSDSTAARTSAADTLYQRAVTELERGAKPQYSYDVPIVGLQQRIRPGQLIRVIYKGFATPFEGDIKKWIDVDDSFLLLEVTTEVDESGLKTVGIQVTTPEAGRWPQNENGARFEAALSTIKAMSSHRQPAITATEAGSTPDVPVISVADRGGFWGGVIVPPMGTINAAVIVGANNQVRAMQMVLPYPVEIGKVVVDIVNATASAVVDVGIYSADANTRLAHTAGISAASIATLSTALAGAPVTLPAGVYWFAWTASNSAVQSRTINLGTAGFINIFNAQSAKKIGTAANSASSGILPSSLGTVTAASINPLMAFFER